LKVVLLGSGGRESALAWALARSPRVDQLVAAPGNPGIAELAHTVACDIEDPSAVAQVVGRVGADLLVVGPEAPLVRGVGDAVRAAGVPVFGPSADAARIEGSKTYAKELMERAQIPTAAWRSFTDPGAALGYLDELGPPYVIKADGLAAGKGVVVTEDRDAAHRAVNERLVQGRFGEAGSSIVIEEYLDGEEASLIAFTDGEHVAVCEPAQDYKRAQDDDRGPNTGGMGSYSPVPACPPELTARIVEEVLQPLVRQTAADGAPFVGALYAGLALTSKGPKVIEFNARFGDPETQALLPRLRSDFAELAMMTATGQLGPDHHLEWSPDACVSVVLASGGYPGAYETGYEIHGLTRAQEIEGVVVFHSGTKAVDGRVVTAGGRVLALSATGATFAEARARAYEAASVIDFEDKHVRSDIALRAEQTERSTT
jgi:phosphoribosylamine--glycine ligase